MKRGYAKNFVSSFEIHKFSFFNILKQDKPKAAPGILRLVSMLFLIFEKRISKKAVPGVLRFVSMHFLIFKKDVSKKTLPAILRFVSILLFNI